jgi:hypothetical protein
MNRNHWWLITVFLASLPLFLAGCSNSAGSGGIGISGTVQYNNKPVTGGEMQLHYEGGVLEIGLRPDGTFVANDAPLGTARVTINTQRIKQVELMKKANPAKDSKGQKPPAPGEGVGTTPVYVAIPFKYMTSATTPLTWEVKPGNEKNNIVLTD